MRGSPVRVRPGAYKKKENLPKKQGKSRVSSVLGRFFYTFKIKYE